MEKQIKCQWAESAHGPAAQCRRGPLALRCPRPTIVRPCGQPRWMRPTTRGSAAHARGSDGEVATRRLPTRHRRRSGTRGSASTYEGRRRRGEAAGSRSTRRRKRGERGQLGVKTRRCGALTWAEAAKVKAMAAWRARTRSVESRAVAASDTAVRRRVRRGERPGCRDADTARARGSHAKTAC
jgi:hypothetical protein